MKKKYKLLDVVHSGRKGLRGLKVLDAKYKGLVGFNCSFDIDDIQQFKKMTFDVLNSWFYDWWTTSEVLALAKKDDQIKLETANSIYIFKELNDVEKMG